MDYVPPFENFKKRLTFSQRKGEVAVTASYEDLVAFVSALLANVPVDEEWYLKNNPDVVKAIKAGACASAKEHFVKNGYFEGRLPFPLRVDERWYLENNPDVEEGVRSGTIASPLDHFLEHGYREGRLPSAR